MASARRWRAKWETVEVPAEDGEEVPLVASEGKMSFMVEPVETAEGQVHQPRLVEATCEDGVASAEFDAWDFDSHPEFAGLLGEGAEFSKATFSFKAVGGGRQVQSRNIVPYADDVAVQLVIDGTPPTPMTEVKYLLMTAWGHREGKTDENGILVEKGLRTGGMCLIANGTTFVSFKQVELNWNHG